MRIAEIVSVGTELLLGQITDTHAPTMARILAECGIGCQRRSTVGDNFDRLVGTLREALSRSDILITIGGLGPTGDDLTRDAIAAALDDTLEEVPEMAARLRDWFTSRNLPFSESNLRQAQKPTCAELIENPNGTAPGLLCQKGGKTVIALPGPKGEFDPMAYGPVRAFLAQSGGGQVIHSRILRICGLGESHVEKVLGDLMEQPSPTVAPYAHVGEVHLRVTAIAGSEEEADRMIDPTEEKIRGFLGRHVYGVDRTTLEEAVIGLLLSQGKTVATAESMTGGGLAERLTSVPGSSGAFRGGIVAYQSGVKANVMGLTPDLTADPVSEATARALAERAREMMAADFGIGITGNAGPGVDLGDKPVGLTFVAIASSSGTKVLESQFRGVREDVRRRATQTALVGLRDAILKSE